MEYLKKYEELRWKGLKQIAKDIKTWPKDISDNIKIKNIIKNIKDPDIIEIKRSPDKFAWMIFLKFPNIKYPVFKSYIYIELLNDNRLRIIKNIVLEPCLLRGRHTFTGGYFGDYHETGEHFRQRLALANPDSISIDDKDDNISNYIKQNLKIDYEMVVKTIDDFKDKENKEKERLNKLYSEIEKRNKKLEDSIEDIQDYLQELEDICTEDDAGKKFYIQKSNGRLLISFNIEGIRTSPSNDEYEARLVFNKKLTEVLKILSLAKTRIERDLPEIEIKTNFRNNGLILIFDYPETNHRQTQWDGGYDDDWD